MLKLANGANVGRDPGDGRERGQSRQAGSMDLRPRLAPGEVDDARRRRASKDFPTHASLSRVSPNNPVLLTHASGHASFANALAMKLSGITRTTTNPDGGEILKDAKGNPTGLLRETASRLIKRGAGEPAPTDEERVARERRVLELASQEALSKGITSFQDAGSSFDDHRSHEGDGRRRQARRPAVDHGPRGQQGRGSRTSRSTGWSTTPTATSPSAPSSDRSTARSARAARGCSSRTPTSPTAPA